jgi:heme exporter protein D
MYFDSLSAALAMEGHGPYVWSVVLVATLIVLYLLLAPVLRSKRIILEQRGALRREQGEAMKSMEGADAPGS